MTSRTGRRSVVVIAIALLLGAAARGQDPAQPAQPDPTAEQRKQMAEIHRKMADCLLSARSFAECRTEMHASCQAQMGPAGCPMMGMGKGMRRGPGMMGGGQPATPAPSAPTPERPAQ